MHAGTREPVVEFAAVTQRYRRATWGPARPALQDFSLQVRPGEMVAVLGANGSGKSTTLRIAAGLLRPTTGVCRLWGRTNPGPDSYRKIGYVPDVCALPSFLSVDEVMDVAARLESSPGASSRETLARVGLDSRSGQRVAALSRGQTQRLGLAVALRREPALLLLDEPLSALDDDGAARMIALLAELRDEGRTVLLTAHRSPDLRRLCDRVVWLRDGRVVDERVGER